jgi:hypothetical protein
MKKDLSSTIKDAIASGKKEYDAKQKAAMKREQEEAVERRARHKILVQACEKWVQDKLPALIKEATAKGQDSLNLYASPYPDITADLCSKIPEIRVESRFIKGSCGEENMYDTEDSWSYDIFW